MIAEVKKAAGQVFELGFLAIQIHHLGGETAEQKPYGTAQLCCTRCTVLVDLMAWPAADMDQD